MALNPEDPRPAALSEIERYKKIWVWYRANVSKLATHSSPNYAKRSVDYIEQLPHPDNASSAQIADVFKHVRTDLLEWAYHLDDGEYKMAAYAGVT